MTVLIESILALVIILLMIVGYVALRIHHNRQIERWIEAGLLVRKPREFVRQSRYHF